MRYNAFGCSGLERYSLIPAFLAAAIFSCSVLVLTAIMGIPGPSVWVEAFKFIISRIVLPAWDEIFCG